MTLRPLFVYGSLMAPEVLGRVLLHDLAAIALVPAQLAVRSTPRTVLRESQGSWGRRRARARACAAPQGYERRAVVGELYPGIVPSAEAHVDGQLVMGLMSEDMARLDAYEGAVRCAPPCGRRGG